MNVRQKQLFGAHFLNLTHKSLIKHLRCLDRQKMSRSASYLFICSLKYKINILITNLTQIRSNLFFATCLSRNGQMWHQSASPRFPWRGRAGLGTLHLSCATSSPDTSRLVHTPPYTASETCSTGILSWRMSANKTRNSITPTNKSWLYVPISICFWT